MTGSKKDTKEPSLLDKFRKSDSKGVAILKELAWVVASVGGIALLLFLISGTWPAVVTIESESMVPHMNVGDLVFVVSADRYGELQSWTEGKESGYKKFGDYGDILIYRPNGAENSPIPIPLISGSVHPIIHRAMGWTGEGETIPKYLNLYRGQASPVIYLPAKIEDQKLVLENGTVIDDTTASPDIGYIVPTNVTAANSGYITKGDNNLVSDQGGYLSRRDLGIIQPVEKEWIVGKALFTVPLLGYIPLNIVPVAIAIVVIMILWEMYAKRNEKEKTSPRKKTGKKK